MIKYTIGIDLGGTFIKIGLIRSGKILHFTVLPADSEKGLRYIQIPTLRNKQLPEVMQLPKVKTIKNITLMKKILVIINKNWETEPVLNALTNPKLRPAAEFAAAAPEGYTANSIETTHGVVKISTSGEPILFLSPITDRLNHFNEDVTDTQNYVSAFNGGLALGELLCALAEYGGERQI